MLIAERYIGEFKAENIRSIRTFTLRNTDVSSASMDFEFEYVNDATQETFLIGMIFYGCRFSGDYTMDVTELLDVNAIEFVNISDRQWEDIKWKIQDCDDDGTVLFKFYCREIRVRFIRKGHSTLFEDNAAPGPA